MASTPKQNINVDKKISKIPNRVKPRIKRPLNLNDNFLGVVHAEAIRKYQPDKEDQLTEHTAIILRTSEIHANTMTAMPSPIIVRARIPEIHAHLPLPRSQNDAQVIDMYPEYISNDPGVGTGHNPGRLVRVKHIDKHHTALRYQNGRILELLEQSVPFTAGFSSIIWECPENHSKTKVKPGSTGGVAGANKKKGSPNSKRGVGKGTDTNVPGSVGKPATAGTSGNSAIVSGSVSPPPCGPSALLEELVKAKNNIAWAGGKSLGPIELDYIKGNPGKGFGPNRDIYVIAKKTPGGTPFSKYLKKMIADAKKDGVELLVNSGFRTMEKQTELYNKNLHRPGFAAKPGTSSHQSGIAVDFSTGGVGGTSYAWLTKHAVEYGFIRTVPKERWHWEYRPAMIRASGPFARVKKDTAFRSGTWPAFVTSNSHGFQQREAKWNTHKGKGYIGNERFAHTTDRPFEGP